VNDGAAGTAGSAWTDGWRRVWAAPAIWIGVWVMTIALAAPLAATVGGMIETQLGGSTEADSAADGVNWDWWQEFTSQSSGLGATFTPQIIGFAATLQNFSDFLDRTRVIAPVAGAVGLYLVTWIFVSGGIIDRYARERATRANGFFAASGVFFFRFLRLALIAAVVFGLLFVFIQPWLLTRWFAAGTANVDSERVVFAWRLLLYAIFGVALAAADCVFTYARVRLVIEDRRSAICAVLAALRFLVRNAGRVTTLYVLDALTFAGALALWAVIAPGAPRGGASVWLTFALMQMWIAVRIALKLHFIASETSLFQASLAHAGYTAAPLPAWPESPAAEAIR